MKYIRQLVVSAELSSEVDYQWGVQLSYFYLNCVNFFTDLTQSDVLLIGECSASFILTITVAVTSFIRAAHIQPPPSILSSYRLSHESWLIRDCCWYRYRKCVTACCPVPLRCVKNARLWYLQFRTVKTFGLESWILKCETIREVVA